MKLLGVVHAFNEADCVGATIQALLTASHEVHCFDHGSTDGTADVMSSFAGVTLHRVDREEVPIMTAKGQPLPNLWQHIGRWIVQNAGDYNWVTWLDADEFLRLPSGRLPRRKDFVALLKHGVQVLEPLVREYWITDRDPGTGEHLDRLRYFRIRPDIFSPRGWVPKLTKPVGGIKRGRHRSPAEWPPGTRILQRDWILEHYPVRSVEQGRRKILKERNWKPPQYGSYRQDDCRHLVKKARSLMRAPEALEMPSCHALC